MTSTVHFVFFVCLRLRKGVKDYCRYVWRAYLDWKQDDLIHQIKEICKKHLNFLKMRVVSLWLISYWWSKVVKSIGKDCQNTVNEIIVVALFLWSELSFEYHISFFHYTEKHFANVQLAQFELSRKLQKVRICLTDKGENPACVFVRFYCKFVGIY